ncbi:membrane-spanning 4-domains subfamily A member 15-like [Sphaerodactylus townsendi]|uniref:membrane-spanning 4-domains subfamily A member 15-like n=1 Tax=Sphaerodactylus townsendi TaxID=933632 RepID=UPI002025BEA5|nr:membrane-spanning 4-domains subfamily A member 15-like [Sphaerodactylus townsendi]
MQMNIASAIIAVTGAVLYITDLAIRPVYYSNGKSVGLGLAILLLLFSTLEFCITIWTAHFGYEATSSDSDMGMMAIPYTISAGGMFPTEVCLSPPPPYDFVASAEK